MFAVQGVYLVSDRLPIEDARLIAAAPEMLEALKDALYFITDIDNSHRSVRKIRATISKAKGINIDE